MQTLTPQNASPWVQAIGTLHLANQAQTKLSNKTITGFEALCRQTTPTQNPVPTETLIHNSEQSGEIVQLGRQVLALLKNDFLALLAKYHPSASA